MYNPCLLKVGVSLACIDLKFSTEKCGPSSILTGNLAQEWRVRNGSAFDEHEAVDFRGGRKLPFMFVLMCVRLRDPEIFHHLTQSTIPLDSIAGSHACCKMVHWP